MLRAALLLSSALQQTRAFEWLAQFPDRGAVDPAAANINLTVYQDPEWAQSWYGSLPVHLRNSERDGGFQETRCYVPAQAEYARDKVLRQHEAKQQDGKSISVLDAGAGGGYMAAELFRTTSWDVTTLDTFPVDLMASWQRAGGPGDAALQRLRASYLQGALHKTSLPAKSVHAVLAFNVLHQVADLRAALAEMARVLTDDGVLVVSTLNRSLRTRWALWWHTEWLRDWPAALHDWRLGVTPDELKALCAEAGLNLVHEEVKGLCTVEQYSMDWRSFPWLLQVKPGGAQACSDPSIRYLAWAYKVPAAAADMDEVDADEAVHDEL